MDILFGPKPTDKFKQSANLYHDWPMNRGIYLNDDQDFIVHINEEDHLKYIV